MTRGNKVISRKTHNIWAASWPNGPSDIRDMPTFKLACTSVKPKYCPLFPWKRANSEISFITNLLVWQQFFNKYGNQYSNYCGLLWNLIFFIISGWGNCTSDHCFLVAILRSSIFKMLIWILRKRFLKLFLSLCIMKLI